MGCVSVGRTWSYAFGGKLQSNYKELRNGRKINTDERGRSENVDCEQSRAYDQNIDNYHPTLLAE